MKAIIKREFKNFLKNPIFWAGLVIVTAGIYQILVPYLNLHYFKSDEEIQSINVSALDDADVMDGYIPLSGGKQEQMEIGYEKIRKEMIEQMGMPKQEADTAINAIRGMNIGEATEYLKSEYSYFGANYQFIKNNLRQGSAEEVNAYIDEKMEQHPYSYYMARKFADFAGLFMSFFATILLAFLFLQDTRKNTYELLHTKPISAWQYVLGKIAGGFCGLLLALSMLTLLFGVLCGIQGRAQGFPVNAADFVIAVCIYILPTLFMIVSVYAVTALIFKNPLPAAPLLFLYMIYSNMGSIGEDGQFGYYGRALAILVRFPGKFFDTKMPPMLMLNQMFLILASMVLIALAVIVWKRRRVY